MCMFKHPYMHVPEKRKNQFRVGSVYERDTRPCRIRRFYVDLKWNHMAEEGGLMPKPPTRDLISSHNKTEEDHQKTLTS